MLKIEKIKEEEKKTYLSEYLKHHHCTYKDFLEHQLMNDGFCPDGLGSVNGCPCDNMDCMECWNQEVKGE